MVDVLGQGKIIQVRGGVKYYIPLRSTGLGSLDIQTKDLDFGDSKNGKFVDSVVLDLNEDVPYGYVQVGGRDRLNDPLTWGSPVSLGDGSGQLFLSVGLEFRFFRLRIVDTAPMLVWKLTGIEFYGSAPEGGRESRNTDYS